MPARAPARDERPEARLDHVEHALVHPVRRRCTARTRTGARSARRRPRPAACAPDAATGTGARARCGRRWRDSPPRSVAPACDELRPPVGEVRRHLDAHVGHQPARLGDEPLHVLDRHRRRPVGRVGSGARAQPRAPVAPRPPPSRSRPAPRRSTGGAGRSSGGSPPAGGRARRAPRRAPRATRRGPPRVSPIPTRIPDVNGILSSPAARIVSSRTRGSFVGEP